MKFFLCWIFVETNSWEIDTNSPVLTTYLSLECWSECCDCNRKQFGTHSKRLNSNPIDVVLYSSIITKKFCSDHSNSFNLVKRPGFWQIYGLEKENLISINLFLFCFSVQRKSPRALIRPIPAFDSPAKVEFFRFLQGKNWETSSEPSKLKNETLILLNQLGCHRTPRLGRGRNNPNLWVQRKINHIPLVLPLGHHFQELYSMKKFGLFVLWPLNIFVHYIKRQNRLFSIQFFM